MASTLVIYNPAAGRGRVLAHWPRVLQALQESGLDFEVAATQAPQDALVLARNAPGRYAQLVCVGGDGTVHEVVNGLMQASGEAETIPLAVLPLGSGDDFAKVIPPAAAVGFRSFDWRSAVDKIGRGQTHLFDVGRMSGTGLRPEWGPGPHYFMNALGVGFGAHALVNLASIPYFLKGFSAYLASILTTLVKYPRLRITLKLDDQPAFEQSTVMTVISSGRCVGNGFWVCPQAQADDGFFDVAIGLDLNRVQILKLLPKIIQGAHVNDPAVRMTLAHRIEIHSTVGLAVEVDGELPFLDCYHLIVEMLPSRLRIMV